MDNSTTGTSAGTPHAPRAAGVSASGLSLRGPRGWVYRDVGFDATAGGLVAVEGPAGSGRTCLLLTLSGRMRPTSGRALVAGHPLPKRMAAVRRIAALGPVTGVNEPDPALTVREHLRERALLQHRFGDGPLSLLRRDVGHRAEREERAMSLAGLDPEALPEGPRTHVRDLSALDTLRLGTALALLARPRLLCVDDVDRGLDAADRAAAWRTLHGLTEAGITVVASCADAAEAPAGTLTVRLTPENTVDDEKKETADARA